VHWRRSTGERLHASDHRSLREIVRRVSLGMELINQTSMTVSPRVARSSRRIGATTGPDVPQLRLVWNDAPRGGMTTVAKSHVAHSGCRVGVTSASAVTSARARESAAKCMSVSGRGARRRISVAIRATRRGPCGVWRHSTRQSVGQWEPTYDPVVWRMSQRLHLFVQRVGQGDGETMEDVAPQPVSILEWNPPAVRCAGSIDSHRA